MSKNRTIEEIEKMSLDEARDAITNRQYGDINSPNYNIAMHCLKMKQDALQDKHGEKSLSIARIALIVAVGAFALSVALVLFEIF